MDPVLGCSLSTTQRRPDLVLLFLCSCNNVLFTALPGHTVGLRVDPCHCMPVFSPTQSLCFCPSLPVCFFSLPVSLSFPHASVRSSVVEDPSPVSENKAPLVGPPSGQGPVPLSVICWYRVQSLSFSESCRSLEVKEPGRQERPCVCVYLNCTVGRKVLCRNNNGIEVAVVPHIVQISDKLIGFTEICDLSAKS